MQSWDIQQTLTISSEVILHLAPSYTNSSCSKDGECGKATHKVMDEYHAWVLLELSHVEEAVGQAAHHYPVMNKGILVCFWENVLRCPTVSPGPHTDILGAYVKWFCICI